MSTLINTWVNSKPQNTVSVFDRGLAFGDGLFETMYINNGRIPLIEYHLHRLLSDAATLGIAITANEVMHDIELALSELNTKHSSTYRLKYILTRGESDSGYAPNPRGSITRIMLLQSYDAGLNRLLQQQGIKACTCQWRLSDQPALAGMKHLNRLDQVMARQEYLDSDCYEGLMLDQLGSYIEGTMSNIFAVTNTNEIITPQLNTCGVEGVMKRVVVEALVPEIGKHCFEAEITRMDEFSEIFITNALIGIIPVIAVDNDTFAIGPVTRSLQQSLEQALKQMPKQIPTQVTKESHLIK